MMVPGSRCCGAPALFESGAPCLLCSCVVVPAACLVTSFVPLCYVHLLTNPIKGHQHPLSTLLALIHVVQKSRREKKVLNHQRRQRLQRVIESSSGSQYAPTSSDDESDRGMSDLVEEEEVVVVVDDEVMDERPAVPSRSPGGKGKGGSVSGRGVVPFLLGAPAA